MMPTLLARLQASRAPRGRALTIRRVIVVGFALVFSLWLLSGYELVRRMAEVEQRSDRERQAALRGERVLSTIRTNVLLGSIYLRDAIIDNPNLDEYRAELDAARSTVERVLPDYLDEVRSPLERRTWDQLKTELEKYWASRELVFAADAPFESTEAAAALRRQVVPNRESVLQIIDRIAQLQTLSEQRYEEDVARLYAELRRRLLLMSTMAIVVGLVVAVAATRQSGHLERHIEAQRVAEQATRRELERLSARLVTVQEQERRSLARELHDEVGQALTAIKLDMGLALQNSDGDPRVKRALEDARNLAETTLQAVRDLSQLLHPSMLDDFGLPETLKQYLKGFSRRTGVQAELTQKGMDERLAPEVEVAVYRIVQEALTNVVRHSGARQVQVALSRHATFLHVTIDDDGAGINAAAADLQTISGGLGLIGMRERAQSLGGTCAVTRRAGGGTRVELWLPATTADGLVPASATHSDLLAG